MASAAHYLKYLKLLKHALILLFIIFISNTNSQSAAPNSRGGVPTTTSPPTVTTFSLIDGVVKSFQSRQKREHRLPYHALLILPSKESNNDKFGLTIEKARAVIDIAVEDVIKAGIMPKNWINLTVHDSRYWEDTSLAERWSTNGVVKAWCERRLDAIFGFADSYSLATVAKISADFGNG